MAESAAMLAHLGQNVSFLCPFIKLISADGLTTVGYSAHTRQFTYNSVVYRVAPVEVARAVEKINLEPNTGEFTGAFDSYITEPDTNSHKWRGGRVTTGYLNYTDLTMGAAAERNGFVGKVFPRSGQMYRMEILGLSSRLNQEIGEATSPTDRNRTLADTGVNVATYTHATTVSTFTDRRKFKVPYVQPSPNYFRYGQAVWTGGANNGREMEIKSSTTTDAGTRTEIELQLSMPSAIAAADAVSLIRGYDGTRDAAKALGATAMANFNGEPDIPGLLASITYPES